MTPAALTAAALTKTYPSLSPGTPAIALFRDLALTLAPGEMLAIIGASGAGKSSLLHILAALDVPTSGTVHCGPIDVTHLSASAAASYRNRDVGYVWQFHYLLPEFTALENIAMPLLARGTPRKQALAEANLWLDRVGLAGRGHHRSGELSGGEQQRVSLARALITRPRLLLADEPTGDLDAATAESIFTLLQQLHREQALASILVTHNEAFAHRCDRVLRLSNGQLITA